MAALASTVVRRVVKEMQSLVQSPPEGIRVLVNEENLADITAWIAGPAGTPYANGYFKVKMSLGSDFPNLPPQ
ncbi:ubiquitin-conjugating enzyme E2 S, partial [Dimargaris xerosporica]